MVRVESSLGASPEQVFAVLSDAHSYARWVVGAKEIRAADERWPEPGSRLHHTVGLGPFSLDDNTKVLECEAPRRLLLEGRARPVGVAQIEFAIAGDDSSTRVRLSEWVVRPAMLAWVNPVLAPLIKTRNTETLRRLADVVAERSAGERRAEETAAPPAEP